MERASEDSSGSDKKGTLNVARLVYVPSFQVNAADE